MPVDDCPVTERYSKTVLSLPLYAEITDREIDYVCEAVNGFRI
jgi:dTDP-4-amino-4,6-dideoxygalactose transaminase